MMEGTEENKNKTTVESSDVNSNVNKIETKPDADAEAEASTEAPNDNMKIDAAQSEDHDWDRISDDIPEATTALQIVSVGSETDQYAFAFHEEALNSIIKKSPDDHKVCVVSVVGAFRTGKSFLLSWFLRYLNHCEKDNANSKGSDAEFGKGGDGTSTDADGKARKWYEKEASTLGNDGFSWRGGAERNTTGIWMWSKPFFVQENVALLLVDTQGMFDHETTMGLTAAIFGMSTLLSSYQIYNVDKRIQEDNLQQLALFSEYGRMALQTDGSTSEKKQEHSSEAGAEAKKDKNEGTDTLTSQGAEPSKPKPFQKIEFLVRDWQNFDDDEDLDACESEMKEYLEKVLAEREAADLKDTREQIMSCFDEVSCYLMTHPGFAVTKKKYTGDISLVEPTFKAFMDRYCGKVFGNGNLVAKSIHGRELTATELGAYIKNYAQMFESGAHFPEASTMLEATASANNSNATNLSTRKYKERMDHLAGARCTDYLSPSDLEKSHSKFMDECMALFEGIATFGSPKSIDDAKNEVIKSIEESYEMYSKLNDGRNPLLGFET